LNAVKKNQANNPDYKTSNLNAVKKNQANNPDYKTSNLNAVKKSQQKQSTIFPPIPPSESLQHTIISNFCKDTYLTRAIYGIWMCCLWKIDFSIRINQVI
jgi:hypothetical protein